jgi:hypothetical protein
MTLSLVALANQRYRLTAEADQTSKRLMDQLGLAKHYVPARLAIASSLAIAEAPPAVHGETARQIAGSILFGSGSDLAVWVSLIIEHAGRAAADIDEFQRWVAAHWARGLRLLSDQWEAAQGDGGAFWRALAAGLPRGAAAQGEPGAPGIPGDLQPAAPMAIPVGPVSTLAATGETLTWRLNAAGGSPHAALMGGVGSGKTRTAVHMLRAMRALTPFALVAFDFKGDMADQRNALDQPFQARVIQPPAQPVPLDVLWLADRTQTGIALAGQRLRDSLATLKRADFGARQRDALSEAAETALRTKTPCTLADVRDALKRVYAQRGMKDDGAIGTLNDLCRVPLFTPDQSPAEFFGRSWIIRLRQDLPNEARAVVVTLVTDALDRWLNTLSDSPTDAEGNRGLRVACVIDEAHRILGAKLPGLSNLIRLSRSKGGAVMLISQQPGDFDGEDDEFLAEMGLVAAFNTNARPAAVKRIRGAGADLSTLGTGEAWIKLRNDQPQRITAWR